MADSYADYIKEKKCRKIKTSSNLNESLNVLSEYPLLPVSIKTRKTSQIFVNFSLRRQKRHFFFNKLTKKPYKISYQQSSRN